MNLIQERSKLLKEVRNFFYERGVYEVDTPIMNPAPSIDQHIDLIETEEGQYLHTSPEYYMKRLLAEGSPDIFELSHVFRKGEKSIKHNPEFMMIEWYRKGFNYEQMIQETCELIQLFTGPIPIRQKRYAELFKEHLGVSSDDPIETLLQIFKNRGITPYNGIEKEGRDAVLNLLLGCFIEPLLGKGELTVVSHYPVSQAANAVAIDLDTAARFEVYHYLDTTGSLELANGFVELTSSEEQRKRFLESNKLRIEQGKPSYPLDEAYLTCLDQLPSMSGVAVGFDRCFMIKHRLSSIEEAIL